MKKITCASKLCPNSPENSCTGCSKTFCEHHLVYLESKTGFTPGGWRCKTCMRQLLIKTGKSRVLWKWVSAIALLFLIIWLGGIPGLSTIMFFLGWIGIFMGPGLYLAITDAYKQQLATYRQKYRETPELN